MVSIVSFLLIVIFLLIASIHFYWGVGGRWAIDNVVPTNEQGERMLKTSAASCFVVGSGLLLFSLYYVVMIISIELPISNIILNAVGWIIPSIFLLRAIGDFNYVGFTKKKTATTFARLDTAYFSPLCLLIALLGLVAMLY